MKSGQSSQCVATLTFGKFPCGHPHGLGINGKFLVLSEEEAWPNESVMIFLQMKIIPRFAKPSKPASIRGKTLQADEIV